MKFYYEVCGGSHYPITTKGYVEANQFHIAARKAVQNHRKDLRDQGKLRKQGDSLTIKIGRIKE